MTEPEATAPPSAPRFITVTLGQQGEEIQTNLPPSQRPLMLWLLEKAKFIVMTQLSEQEKSKLVKPSGNSVAGLLRRTGKG